MLLQPCLSVCDDAEKAASGTINVKRCAARREAMTMKRMPFGGCPKERKQITAHTPSSILSTVVKYLSATESGKSDTL